MPWIDKKITFGKTKLCERHFKCGWCGTNEVIHPDQNVPSGWVATAKPDPVDYFCSRRCRHDYITIECN